MNITLRNSVGESRLSHYLESRLETSLRRFSNRISEIEVVVRSENAGKDLFCSLDLKLIPRGIIHVSAKHENVHSAISKAVQRAENAMAKTVDRSHSNRSTGERAEFVEDDLFFVEHDGETI